MKARLIRFARWAAYPAFYLFCLGIFGYFAFPYDRLKDRLIAEFDRMQQKRSPGAPQRLEIDSLDAYWFTGLKVKGARIFLPPSSEGSSFGGAGGFPGSDAAKPDAPPKHSVIEIEEAHARVKILPLLIGHMRIEFWASVFGGEVKGTVPVGKSGGWLVVDASSIELGKVEPLGDMLGLPLRGTASAKLELEAPEGKFNKANGTLELTASDVLVGDGKTKIKGLIALPEAKLGELSVSAESKDGVLKITKMAANGADLELAGDGKVNVREPWNSSTADLFVRFKFTDAYRGKTDLTKSLLGAPGSSVPPLIEMQEPRLKRAKRADGFYGWHVYGPLKRPKFDPQSADSPAARKAARGGDSPFGAPSGGMRRPGSPNLPVGPSDATPRGDDANGAAPPPQEDLQTAPPVRVPPMRQPEGDAPAPEGQRPPPPVE